MEKEFPYAYKYLQSKRNELSGRGYFENSNKNWYELWNQRDPTLFQEKKILTPYVSDKNNFALSRKNVFFNTCAYGVKVPGYSNSYILGTLNSSLIEFFHKINTVKQRGGHFRYATDFLELLPVYLEEKKEIVKLTSEAVKIRSNIDEEIHSFLEWVELEWNVEIENLALKTHIKKYWDFDFEEMARIAQKNKSKIVGSVDSRKFKDLFKTEWQNSSHNLERLTKKLDTVERKIDAIVYELYGLNEGEVRTVLDSLETPEDKKSDILAKFREISNT